MDGETAGELKQDVILGLGFLALAVATLRRLRACVKQGGLETVIMTFYSLILFTSVIRAVWFLIPTSVLQPSYAPTAQYAFEGDWWVGTYASHILLFLGSLSLFSIFILIAIYWADLLKKIFKDSVRSSRPMASFTTVVACLAAAEGLNSCLFLLRIYSSQGMIMFDSVLLTMLCLVYSVEISRFSHRFRTVLRTLGAINQVSTETQVALIVRTTVTGNVFFVVRGACEVTVGMLVYQYYRSHHTFDIVFSACMWDWYIFVKHSSEWVILALMLYILHVPEGQSGSTSQYSQYDVLGEEDEEETVRSIEEGSTASRGGDEYWNGSSGAPGRIGYLEGRQPLNAHVRKVDEYGAI